VCGGTEKSFLNRLCLMNARVKLFSKNFTMNKTEVERSMIKYAEKKRILDAKLAR